MPGHLLVEACATADDRLTLVFGNARTIVVHRQAVTALAAANAQVDLGFRPFAGVVQEVAQQLQEVLPIPGQA
ncbi:hypothetical protein D3C78_1411470 [compost metagenome]